MSAFTHRSWVQTTTFSACSFEESGTRLYLPESCEWSVGVDHSVGSTWEHTHTVWDAKPDIIVPGEFEILERVEVPS